MLAISSTLPLLECVPNFSEGLDQSVIKAIAMAIENIPDQYLLHQDISPAANRTVMTFAGTPEAVLEAAFQAIKCAQQYIDLSHQKGVHPRLGATDVCPLIPLANISNAQAIAYSEHLAKRVYDELGIPTYLYEKSAKNKYRTSLPSIRKGEYEGLFTKLNDPLWQPDYGKLTTINYNIVKKSGATIIGVRDILVAFNISLDTKNVTIAKNIAEQLRSIGRKELLEDGSVIQYKGLLKKTRAIGWYMEDFECAQVSMNLLDYNITSPLMAWEACKSLALEYDTEVIGCEIIGLVPKQCIIEAGIFSDNSGILDEVQLIEQGINYLQLNAVKAFSAQEKILEIALKTRHLI